MLLGNYRGKVGPVQLVKWKGINIMKGLPSHRLKRWKASDQQQKNIVLFAKVSRFAQHIKKVIKIGFQVPKGKKMSEVNLATSYFLLNAVIDDGANYALDLEKIKFSQPVRFTENGWNAKLSSSEDHTLSITWQLNPFPEKSTELDDIAVVVVYNKLNAFFTYRMDVTRHHQLWSMKLDSEWQKSEMFCWLFFMSSDGKRVSETQYLGQME